jgi:hypothetical protein
VLPVAALTALALTAGDLEGQASVGAAVAWDSNLSHSTSAAMAVGGEYGAARGSLGGMLLWETTSLYAGLRLEGESYPTLSDLSTASVGVEAALVQDLSGTVAVILVPSAARSWYGDPARDATTLTGRATLRWRPVEDLALRAFYAHASRSASDPAFSFERDQIGGSAEWRVASGTFLSLGYSVERGGEVFYRPATTGGGGMGMGGHVMNTFGRAEEAYRANATAHAVSPALEVRLGGDLLLEASYTWRSVSSSAGTYVSNLAMAGLTWRP